MRKLSRLALETKTIKLSGLIKCLTTNVLQLFAMWEIKMIYIGPRPSVCDVILCEQHREVKVKTNSKGKPPEFSNVQWISKLAFVVYITDKLNCLNAPSGPVTRLQGFGRENKFSGRKDFCFYHLFETNLSWHNKLSGGINLWMPLRGWRPVCHCK